MAKTQYLRDNAEELLNSLTHAVTLGIAIMATHMLTSQASSSGLQTWPYYLFGISMCTTFLGSVLYHGAFDPIVKSRLRLFDLISIFVAIGGGFISLFRIFLPDTEFYTYTGISLLVLVFCIFVKFKVFRNSNSFWPALGVYLLAGWSNILFLLDTNCLACPEASGLLLAGGAMYTIGSLFYMYDYKRYFHTIWHLCASLGFVIHLSALVRMT